MKLQVVKSTARILFFFFSNACVIFAAEVPCNSKFGIDISDGEILENGAVSKEGIEYAPGNYVRESDGTVTGCICKVRPCLRKCCPMGEYLTNKTCQPTAAPFVIQETLGPELDNFHVIYGSECGPKKKRTLWNPQRHSQINAFVLERNGELYLSSPKIHVKQMDYCLDYIEDENEIKALVCSENKNIVSTTNVIGMIISMPFLLATFIVYALLPDRNLHGKCLMCYVITLFLGYLFLVIVNWHAKESADAICITGGVFSYFFFMTSFCLMNVMSIDIWWTFSGLRGFSGSRKVTEQKRFLLYSSYAWGVPLILAITVSSLTVQTDSLRTAWYHPGIADGKCWFTYGYPQLLYFHGPLAILMTINITLFIITAFKIKQVQKDTAVLRNDQSRKHNYENDKQRFNLFFKLMLAMGINWSMEIISGVIVWQVAGVPEGLWYLTDFVNAIYGVFIFFIFVFKVNVWRLLKKRYYMVMGKPNLAKTVTLVDYTPRVNSTPPDSKLNVGKATAAESNILTSQVA